MPNSTHRAQTEYAWSLQLMLRHVCQHCLVQFVHFSLNYNENVMVQGVSWKTFVELIWNLVAHGDAREGKWRGNWWMEWVTSTLTPSANMVYPALLKLMRTPRLPAVDWTDAPTDLNGLVRFGERRNLVSALVPSRSARAIHTAVIKKLTILRNMEFHFLLHKIPA